MKRFVLFLTFILFGLLNAFQTVHATDDFTQIFMTDATQYQLEKPELQNAQTADGISVAIELNAASVSADEIQVRLAVWNLPSEWQAKMDDSRRIYGEYLPTAELKLPNGEVLIPDSASRYSLLTDKDQLVSACLLIFRTTQQPQNFSLLFNQIPFDHQPLASGAVFEVALHPVQRDRPILIGNQPQTTVNGVTFALLSNAQSATESMFQVAAASNAPLTTIARMGEISLHDAQGYRLALRRGYPFGFNLTNDQHFFTNISYYFSPVLTEQVLNISLDYVIIRRSVHGIISVNLDDFTPLVFNVAGFQVEIRHVESIAPNRVRLEILTDPALTAINFYPMEQGSVAGSSICGTINDQFFCDVFVQTLPQGATTFSYDAIETRVDGPWQIQWEPVVFPKLPPFPLPQPQVVPFSFRDVLTGNDQIDEVLRLFEEKSASLSRKSGWIAEKQSISTEFDETNQLPTPFGEAQDQAPFLLYETYSQIDANGIMQDFISVTRDESGAIISGYWNTGNRQIAFPSAMMQDNIAYNAYAYPYIYGDGFLRIVDSNAVLDLVSECSFNERGAKCFRFTQILGDGNAPTQVNTFWISTEDGTILNWRIDCNERPSELELRMCLMRETLSLEYIPQLPPDIQMQIEKILF